MESKPRTNQQNKALHLWLTQLADEMNRNGITLQDVVERIKKMEIKPTKNALKEVLVHPLIQVSYKKDSTAKLDKIEIDNTYDIINKFVGQEFEIHVPFPSQELLQQQDPNFISNRPDNLHPWRDQKE